MSLQRRLVLPPLALGINPAPLPKKKDDKKEDKREDKKEEKKDDDKNAKDNDEEKNKDDVKQDKDNNQAGNKAQDRAVKEEDKSPAVPLLTKQDANGILTPPSPGSMIPEPPTPGLNEPASPAPKADDDPKVPPPQPEAKDLQTKEAESKKSEEESGKESEEEIPPPPLRLIGPVPNRPIKTRLDLNPAIIYPPINTDPRGAYHKYAKFMQGEWILIDVTKDGWLSEQWKEKTEREALAMLRGESEMRAKREAERAMRDAVVRKIPSGAEEILLELWNDLVEANNHEITVLDFWAKYDWSDPEAKKHLAPARKIPPNTEDDAKPTDDQVKGDMKDSDVDKVDNAPIQWNDGLDDVEWTKEGLEEILATVGIQCQYNTAKPLPRNWMEPAGAYLVLGHGFFMLRTEDILQWKSEEAAQKFEMLVTSGHDRVFGEMVKAQQAEERKKKEKEYRERKMAERKKAEEEARKKKKAAALNGGNDKLDDKPRVDEVQEPGTPGSNVKVKDGEEVVADNVRAIAIGGDKVVLAVPVPQTVGDKAGGDKHEAEPVIAVPGEATKPDVVEAAKVKAADEAEEKLEEGKDDKAEKDKNAKKPFDPIREAELLAKMVAAGQTPPGMGMEDIKLAFKALEAAAGSKDGKDKKAKEQQPYIWTWHDSCEKWRWRNYEQELHNIGPGGWEERDWKVFADDRGCDEFDLEEQWAEEEETDVHDWSL